MVKYIHFNDKYKQFKNILITNTQNNLAMKYNKDEKCFISVDKNELLDDLISERMEDISGFYEELENDLDNRTKEIIEKFIEKMDSDEFSEDKKKNIKLIIYNNRNKVTKEITQDLEVIV
jgi:hypothetical protein